MTIGERIKRRRLELGLTVENVAEKLCKNRATVYRYESDEINNLPISILEPLAKVLNCTPAYLMGWEEMPEEKNIDKPDLTADEKQIIDSYKKLNDMGKGKASAYIEGLLENPSYCKHSVRMVAEMPVSVPPKVIKKRRHT